VSGSWPIARQEKRKNEKEKREKKRKRDIEKQDKEKKKKKKESGGPWQGCYNPVHLFSFLFKWTHLTSHATLCRQGTQSQGDEYLFLSYIQSMEFITFSLWGSFIFPLQAR